MNKNYRIGLLALGLSSAAHAGTMGPTDFTETPWANVITLSAGPVWASGAKLQNLYFSPELTRTYTVNESTQPLTQGEIFLGRQRVLNAHFEGQLGVALVAVSKLKLSGDIWDFESPRFYNYTNTYTVQHQHIALKGKILANHGHKLKPWISASIGAGSNKAANYNQVPLICDVKVLTATNFPSRRTTSFVYTLGAGLQQALTQHWQIGVGYEFADWGKSSLGGAAAQPAGNKGLAINNIHTNGLLFNITWLG